MGHVVHHDFVGAATSTKGGESAGILRRLIDVFFSRRLAFYLERLRKGVRSMRGLFPTVAIWTLIGLNSGTLYALNPDRHITELAHRSWGAKEGAPSLPQALAQTRDGYLWIGCRSGLFRFDGAHFEHIESFSGVSLPSIPVSALFAMPDGKLWIGFRQGGVSLVADGRVTNYAVAEGLPEGYVRGFARDRQGTTWVATEAGLARLEADRWHRIGMDWGYPSRSAQAVLVDHLGALWVVTEDRFLVLADGSKKFETTDEPHAGLMGQMAESPDGKIWIADSTRSVRPLERPGSNKHFSGPTRAECLAKFPNSWKIEASCRRPDNLEIYVGSGAIHFDRDGGFWITTLGDGLRRAPLPARLKLEPIDEFGNALESFTVKDGLSADYVHSIIEDREGSIWVGTREGLDQFRNSTLVPVTLPRSSTAFSLAADNDGYVWVADFSEHVYRLHDGIENIYHHPFPGMAVYGDRRGSIWLRNYAQICRVKYERCIDNGLPAGKKNPYYDPIQIAADKSGRLWAYVYQEGLFYLEDGTWNRHETPAELSGLTPSTQYTEATGRIWFGFADDRFASLDNGSIRVYTAADGLAVGFVEAIFPSGGHLWVGGSRGLALLENNKFRTIIPSDRESFIDVSGVIETEDGNLWLNESRGVIHIDAPELHRLLSEHASSVRYELLDWFDGLLGYALRSSGIPTAIQGTDGRLWFTTTRGVAWLDPKSLSKNTLAPPVVIKSVIADGKPYDQSNYLQLPAGTTKLQFNYAGLSLAVPERVMYRYQLEGLDRDWQSSSVPGVAYYTNLSPGDYKFRVIAANNDGLWNTTGASLNFGVLPAFYQTKWFYSLCALSCVALLGGLYRIRIRQVSAQVRGRLEERLAERERIARELHDTLLQGIQGLVLRFQAAADRLPAQEPVRTQLEDALERADQVLSESRDAVKNIRGSRGAEAELAQAIAATGKQLARAHLGQFRASVEGTVRELHPIVREEALRIAREALTNAFQHAKAEVVEVDVSYGEAELHVRVRDDGQGMNDDVLRAGRPGHWGLLGMRERAKKIRANLTLWSKPGAGTEIDLRVPSGVAYRSRSSRHSGWRWRRFLWPGSREESRKVDGGTDT